MLNIQPHKVSRDLSGYITYIYGAPKTGKTTLATQMEGSLLLAFESGYNALPGVMAQDITSWGEMKQVFRELKKPEVQAVYKAIIVDTIDVAADRCKKYVCQQNSIEDLGDLGYGKGWTKFKDEFIKVQKDLSLKGYVVISVGLFGHSGDNEVWTNNKKEMLDNIHKQKIDMSDAIMVINPNDYIGESTKNEIEYAKSQNKEIFYYSKGDLL